MDIDKLIEYLQALVRNYFLFILDTVTFKPRSFYLVPLEAPPRPPRREPTFDTPSASSPDPQLDLTPLPDRYRTGEHSWHSNMTWTCALASILIGSVLFASSMGQHESLRELSGEPSALAESDKANGGLNKEYDSNTFTAAHVILTLTLWVFLSGLTSAIALGFDRGAFLEVLGLTLRIFPSGYFLAAIASAVVSRLAPIASEFATPQDLIFFSFTSVQFLFVSTYLPTIVGNNAGLSLTRQVPLMVVPLLVLLFNWTAVWTPEGYAAMQKLGVTAFPSAAPGRTPEPSPYPPSPDPDPTPPPKHGECEEIIAAIVRTLPHSREIEGCTASCHVSVVDDVAHLHGLSSKLERSGCDAIYEVQISGIQRPPQVQRVSPQPAPDSAN